jgi:hypothetical protein
MNLPSLVVSRAFEGEEGAIRGSSLAGEREENKNRKAKKRKGTRFISPPDLKVKCLEDFTRMAESIKNQIEKF